MKEHDDLLAALITYLINTLMKQGFFPSSLIVAGIVAIFKIMDKTEMIN